MVAFRGGAQHVEASPQDAQISSISIKIDFDGKVVNFR